MELISVTHAKWVIIIITKNAGVRNLIEKNEIIIYYVNCNPNMLYLRFEYTWKDYIVLISFSGCNCNVKNIITQACDLNGYCTDCKTQYVNGVDKCNTCIAGLYYIKNKCKGMMLYNVKLIHWQILCRYKMQHIM